MINKFQKWQKLNFQNLQLSKNGSRYEKSDKIGGIQKRGGHSTVYTNPLYSLSKLKTEILHARFQKYHHTYE